MLIKLFRHELKATYRIFFPLYGLLLAFAALNRLMIRSQNLDGLFGGLLVAIPAILYLCLIIAIIAMCFVIIIQRFYKNLLGDEGYLSHTLPVRMWHHLFCKACTAAMWILLSSLMVFLSVLVMSTDVQNWGPFMREIRDVLELGGNLLGIDAVTFVIGLIILVFVLAVEFTLMLYAGMSIGQTFSDRKTAMSILFVIVLQILATIVIASLYALAGALFPAWAAAMSVNDMDTAFAGMFYWLLVSYTLLGALYALTSHRLLKRNLNLA